MNSIAILQKLPFTGLLKELLSVGILELVEAGILTSKESEIHDRAIEHLRNLSKKFETEFSGVPSSKIVLNDVNAYFKKTKRLKKWYGVRDIPQDYIGLMIYALKGTLSLLEKGKLDLMKRLGSVSLGKKIVMGIEYNDSLAIVPAIVKQSEFYEYQHEFLKPTAGRKPEILLDPVWFAILAIGFMRCFAGYYGGRYYFITKSDIETVVDYAGKTHSLHNAIVALTGIHTKIKPLLLCEELYELKLSYALAHSQVILQQEVFPLKVYEISIIGNAYTCTKTLSIDLTDSVRYFESYINHLRNMLQYPFTVSLKGESYDDPMQALLELAERELSKPVKGDNSMLLLIFVKDLYRAIHVKNPRLMEETLLRLLRISHAMLTSKKDVNLLLKLTIRNFMYNQHVSALIHACKS